MVDTARDAWANDDATVEGPATDYFNVTPHDTNAQPNVSSGIVCGVVGALKVTTKRGTAVTIPSSVVSRLPVIPLQVTHIWATGTTASEIGVFFSR